MLAGGLPGRLCGAPEAQGKPDKAERLLSFLSPVARDQRPQYPPGQRRFLPDGSARGGCAEALAGAHALRAGPAYLCRFPATRHQLRARCPRGWATEILLSRIAAPGAGWL